MRRRITYAAAGKKRHDATRMNPTTPTGQARMDAYEKVEKLIIDKHGKSATTRKAIGDFMLSDDHAVNIKSNNLHKKNYSPNIISINRLQKWVFEEGKKLSFIFVDYEIANGDVVIKKESGLIPVEHLSWDCLSIEAQGHGVIQLCRDLKIDTTQTLNEFHAGLIKEYERYKMKEEKKHRNFSNRLHLHAEKILEK